MLFRSDPLVIAGKTYSSRLLVGTGKYRDFAETRAAVDASGAQIVTVAIRRTNIGQNPNEPSLLEALPPSTGPLGPDDLPDRVARAEDARRSGFAGNPHDEDIVDPLGLPLESFRAIAWELDEWTARLTQSLYGSAPAAAAAGLDEEGC